jgi:hypothetical protein
MKAAIARTHTIARIIVETKSPSTEELGVEIGTGVGG